MQKLVTDFQQIADRHMGKPSERVPEINPATRLLRNFCEYLGNFSNTLERSTPIIAEIAISNLYSCYTISLKSGKEHSEAKFYYEDAPSLETLTEVYMFFNDSMDKFYDTTLKNDKLIVRLRSHKRI